ncbi:hypothetical protein BV22DRAFT_1058262 [Leucogyrophana mollusca]|uniref:Uncharacterized protein n=1 Tax=Leucogyrophana mollusca TaxID=85980 RepID=A0ACB8BTI3_9AGAM|nr:hypothetical protein BV22DRAFT_1058262 [Leucogyrophana mollusca]
MLVPLTFPACVDICDTEADEVNALEASVVTEGPSSLISWGRNGVGPSGAAIGGKHGSLYIFQPTSDTSTRLRSPTPTVHLPILDLARPTSPTTTATSNHSRRHSRSFQRSHSTSPSGSSSALGLMSVPQRSRVVSGLSREQVEAPKNYVDYDDEPEKLKDMLKGKNIRERSLVDAILPSFDKGLVIDRDRDKASTPNSNLPTSPSSASLGRRDGGKSLLSATNSPSFTTKTLSAPPSPQLLSPPLGATSPPLDPSHPQPPLSLKYHAFPARCSPVTIMHALDEHGLLLSLQASGDVSVFDIRDCTQVAGAGIREVDGEEAWVWSDMRVLDPVDNTTLVLTYASSTPSPQISPHPTDTGADEDDETPRTDLRLALFELHLPAPHGVSPAVLACVAEWSIDGVPGCVELYRDEDASPTSTPLILTYLSPTHHLITQPLALIPPFQLHLSPSTTSFSSAAPEKTTAALAIPNPFRALGSKSTEDVSRAFGSKSSEDHIGRLRMGKEVDGGSVCTRGTRVLGLRARARANAGEGEMGSGRIRGLVWSEGEVSVFECGDTGEHVRPLFSLPFSDTKVASGRFVDDEHFVVVLEVRWSLLSRFKPKRGLNADFYAQDRVEPKLIQSRAIGPHEAIHCSSTAEALVLRQKAGRMELVHASTTAKTPSKATTTTVPNSAATKRNANPPSATLTSLLPLELNLIILGYSDGRIRRTSLTGLAGGGAGASIASAGTSIFDKVSDLAVDGARIESLHLVRNDRTKERFVVGGADDGGIGVWSLDTLKLCARWTVFLCPLIRVVQLQNEKAGPLRGCVLCVSQDGTIAVFVIDGFQFQYLIPGAASPLRRICTGGDNLLLVYADESARLWDGRTGEFWRSMGADKVEELLGQGGWMQMAVDGKDQQPSTSISTLPNGASGPDSLCTLLLDLERFLKYTGVAVKSMSTAEAPTSTLAQLRAVLSVLLTPGLNEDIDSTCVEKLGIHFSSGSAGYSSASSTVLFQLEAPRDAWCISGKVSAARALVLTAILKTLSLHEELYDDCQTVITFYVASLAHVVGPSYKPPDLAYLARQWFGSSNEMRQAARVLFDAGVVRLSDEESIALVDAWQHHLPCLQPSADKDSAQAALALFLCGYMAGEKYSLMSTNALIDISKSVASYLHDDQSAHRALAIDLCSRGFQIWQHYVDAMEILRALCGLATSTKKENISTQNVGPQARLAVLQIASSNTPLFMTTLTLDILNPRNLEHRKSVMQLVAFLIRKKPLILYPNLPRLMEAVVKSLDPNSSANRDAVLDTATEILGHVVKTFPTIDFHMATQRLAVGTSEGAFIMYDLKTATHLYILEGHKKRPTACSFSPDGRRLVTVSLAEGVVLVWKVGSSFTSFFKPGAPPRQGHSGSQPYKTLAFNVGNEANMTIAGTLEWVRFEWPAERSVRLRIRESVLTFST